MAHTTPGTGVAPNPELTGLRNIVESTSPFMYGGMMVDVVTADGVLPGPFWVTMPSPERVAWDAALQWLRDRAAADAEWPWPKRAEYDRRRDLGYYSEAYDV